MNPIVKKERFNELCTYNAITGFDGTQEHRSNPTNKNNSASIDKEIYVTIKLHKFPMTLLYGYFFSVQNYKYYHIVVNPSCKKLTSVKIVKKNKNITIPVMAR